MCVQNEMQIRSPKLDYVSTEGDAAVVNPASKNRGFLLQKILQGIGFKKSSKSFFPDQGNPLTRFEQKSAYIKRCVADLKSEIKNDAKEAAKAEREIEKEDKKSIARQEKFNAKAEKKSNAYKAFQKRIAREMAGGADGKEAFDNVTQKLDAKSMPKTKDASGTGAKFKYGLLAKIKASARNGYEFMTATNQYDREKAVFNKLYRQAYLHERMSGTSHSKEEAQAKAAIVVEAKLLIKEERKTASGNPLNRSIWIKESLEHPRFNGVKLAPMPGGAVKESSIRTNANVQSYMIDGVLVEKTRF